MNPKLRFIARDRATGQVLFSRRRAKPVWQFVVTQCHHLDVEVIFRKVDRTTNKVIEEKEISL